VTLEPYVVTAAGDVTALSTDGGLPHCTTVESNLKTSYH
jgi:hypothetical protein